MKKLFFLDHKTIDDLNMSETENSVLQVLKRYSLKTGDYEQNLLTEAIFNRLGWSNKYKDTIFSFRTIICNIFEVYSKKNTIKLDDGNRIIFYFRNNTLEYEINNHRNDKYRYNKDTLFRKATDKNSALNKVINLIFEDENISNNLETVARLVDSLSNFTTHPGYPFNQAKGKLENVADSLNLMVDKIQECVDNNDDLVYGNKSNEIVNLDELKKWKEWFITNQSAYCLNKFYVVTNDNRIKGIELFRGQSLTNPLPKDEEEIKNLLEKIIELLNKRGEIMNESIH